MFFEGVFFLLFLFRVLGFGFLEIRIWCFWFWCVGVVFGWLVLVGCWYVGIGWLWLLGRCCICVCWFLGVGSFFWCLGEI